MYLDYFDLTDRPFQINTDASMLWLGEKHKEALATLKYGIYENKGFLLLTGNIGTGKTTLINALISSMGKDVIYAIITNPDMERLDFLNYIARLFHIKRIFKSKGEFLIYFSHFLRKAKKNQKQVLLVVDESQKLNQELLDEIRLLSNIEIQSSKLINIFFVGQNEFNDILNRDANMALKQRITLNYNLKSLTKKETYQYIQYRLKISGDKNNIFKKDAIEEVYDISRGIPRTINIICDHALLTGYVKGKRKIDKSIIRECAGDIEIKGSVNGGEEQDHQSIRPNGRNSLFKAAALLSFFMIAWTVFGFSYYNYTDGGSFDNVKKYWTQGYNKIKNEIFNGLNIEKNIKEIEKESKKQDNLNSNKNDSEHLAEEKILKLHLQEHNGRQISLTEKRELEYDAPNELESLNENIKSNKSASVEITDANTISDHLQTVLDSMNTHTEVNIAVAEPATFIVPNIDRNIIISEDKELKIEEKDKIRIEKQKEEKKEYARTEIDKQFVIHFDYNSNHLNSDADRIMKEIIGIAKKHSKARFIVKGHTDVAGNRQSNIILSKQRADRVKNYLNKKGIELNRIETVGLAGSEPIASNDTRSGRIVNRRVEIEILHKG